jgi:hypothetical protein
MKNVNAGLRVKPANPFLQVPSFTSHPSIASRADLLHSLRACLSAINGFCREKGDPLGTGDVRWPGERWLSGLSEDIRILALKHKRGGNTIWSCVKAIDSRYPSLRLGKSIENMVNRAAKLCQEPVAITIEKRAIAGSRAAQKSFHALKLFREGKCELSSVDWDEYREILTPAPGQNCQAKAAEIVMDWLRWTLGIGRDVGPLKYWIGRIGNVDLASRLMPRDSAEVYDRMREEGEKARSQKKAAVRQAIFRLRKGLSKLEDDLRSFATLLRSTRYQLVQEELQTIDSVESTDRERALAATRLIHYTGRKPDAWRRFFVKIALRPSLSALMPA